MTTADKNLFTVHNFVGLSFQSLILALITMFNAKILIMRAANANVFRYKKISRLMTVWKNCFWKLKPLANYKTWMRDHKIFCHVLAAISLMKKDLIIDQINVKAAIAEKSTIWSITDVNNAISICAITAPINSKILNKGNLFKTSLYHLFSIHWLIFFNN